LKANTITAKLREQALKLERSHGIKVAFSRKNAARLISISTLSDGDGNYTHRGSEGEPSRNGDGLPE